jgi:serine/threonine protein kinase
LRHPNIVESYRAFTFEGITHIVLELCANGSLYNLVKTCGRIAENEVGRYIIQLAGGIKYIHSRGVMHRDIKLDNIFVDELGDVKIGDFSLAAYIQPSNDGLKACGTLGYMAPEMFNPKERGPARYTEQVDLWSLGVTW